MLLLKILNKITAHHQFQVKKLQFFNRFPLFFKDSTFLVPEFLKLEC